MARERDEFEEEDFGSRMRGGSSLRSSGTDPWKNSAHKDDKTTDFDTSSLVGEDGTFLGFKLSPSVAGAVRMVDQGLLPWVRRKIEDNSFKYGRDFAHKQWGYGGQEAAKFGLKAANAAGIATIFHEQIFDAASITAGTIKSMNELRQAVSPLAKINGGSEVEMMLGGSDNEVITNARHKVYAIGVQRVIKSAAHAVSAIPQFFIRSAEHKERQAKLIEAADEELISKLSVEEQAKRRLEKLNLSWKEEAEAKRGFDAYLKTAKEEYLKEYKAFETKNKSAIKKALEKELEANRDHGDYITSGYAAGPRIRGRRLYQADGRTPLTDTRGRHRFDIPKEELEKHIKIKFAEERGAWDESWLPERGYGGYGGGYGGYGQNNSGPKTLKGELTERFNKLRDSQNEAKNKQDAKKDEKENQGMLDTVAGAGGAILGEIAGHLLGTQELQKFKEDIALDLILHVRRCMDQNPDCKTIPSRGKNSADKDDWGFNKAVHKIFQQNQRDSSHAEIGEREFIHFKEKNWDDEEIQKLDDKNLTVYEVAVKHIAHRIQDGRMDAIALINLVGDRKIVNKSGKSFGTQGKGGGEEAAKQSVMKEIDKQTTLLKAHHDMDEAKISESLSDFTFSVDELKAAFGPKGLKGEEKAFLFMLVDSNISDDKALEKITGLELKKIENLRKEVQGRFGRLLEAAIVELAEIAEQSPDKLKKIKETDEEISKLQDVAAKVQEHTSEDVTDALSKEEKKSVETTVANYLMSSDDKENFWQKLVKRSREPREVKATEHQDGEKDPSVKAKGGDGASADEGYASHAKQHGKKHASKKHGRHHDGDEDHAHRHDHDKEMDALFDKKDRDSFSENRYGGFGKGGKFAGVLAKGREDGEYTHGRYS